MTRSRYKPMLPPAETPYRVAWRRSLVQLAIVAILSSAAILGLGALHVSDFMQGWVAGGIVAGGGFALNEAWPGVGTVYAAKHEMRRKP